MLCLQLIFRIQSWHIPAGCRPKASAPPQVVRLYRPILTRSVASENPSRRGGVRRVWLFQAQGRQQSMGGFSPQPGAPGKRTLFDGVEAEGTGPIFLISSLLVAPVTGYSSLLAPRTEKNWLPSLSCQYRSIQPRYRDSMRLITLVRFFSVEDWYERSGGRRDLLSMMHSR
jgi:hypothetical protein